MAIFDLLSGQEIVLIEQNNAPCEDAPCTPFCICSNCVPVLDIPETEIVLPKRKTVFNPKESPIYHSNYLPSSFNKEIWQPPKLG